MSDRGVLGLGGDQDYDSMIGWEPESVKRRKKLAKRILPDPPPEMFLCRSMNNWMETAIRERPPEDALFGPFWLRNELAIMFSSAGVGKSLLATQIAEYLARGFRIAPFDTGTAVCRPEKVLYLDFELSRDQLVSRYSVTGDDGLGCMDLYSFSPGIIRSEHYWNGRIVGGFESFTEMLFDEVNRMVQEFQIGVLIVDNITFLDRPSTVNTDISLGIMRRLNEIKRSEFLSVLVLAHASKTNGQPAPLTEADLQGSVNLCNFSDSVFALGRCIGSPDLRYLKQIKSRSGRIEYDARNVPVFSLGKIDLAASIGIVANARPPLCNFLGFTFEECREEIDLLPRSPFAPASWHLDQRAAARRLARQGRSLAAIAAEIGVSKATAQRYVSQRKVLHARAL